MFKDSSLKYFFGAYKGICILTIYGLTSIENLPTIDKMLIEIKKDFSKKYIIDFNNTDTIDECINLAIINLKNIIKEKKADVVFCGLCNDLKDALIDEGILEPKEYSLDPRQAYKLYESV